jgi:hypothetical protein
MLVPLSNTAPEEEVRDMGGGVVVVSSLARRSERGSSGSTAFGADILISGMGARGVSCMVDMCQ